ncbi:hypothetical protein E2320_012513, partial [Naja naja]
MATIGTLHLELTGFFILNWGRGDLILLVFDPCPGIKSWKLKLYSLNWRETKEVNSALETSRNRKENHLKRLKSCLCFSDGNAHQKREFWEEMGAKSILGLLFSNKIFFDKEAFCRQAQLTEIAPLIPALTLHLSPPGQPTFSAKFECSFSRNEILWDIWKATRSIIQLYYDPACLVSRKPVRLLYLESWSGTQRFPSRRQEIGSCVIPSIWRAYVPSPTPFPPPLSLCSFCDGGGGGLLPRRCSCLDRRLADERTFMKNQAAETIHCPNCQLPPQDLSSAAVPFGGTPSTRRAPRSLDSLHCKLEGVLSPGTPCPDKKTTAVGSSSSCQGTGDTQFVSGAEPKRLPSFLLPCDTEALSSFSWSWQLYLGSLGEMPCRCGTGQLPRRGTEQYGFVLSSHGFSQPPHFPGSGQPCGTSLPQELLRSSVQTWLSVKLNDSSRRRSLQSVAFKTIQPTCAIYFNCLTSKTFRESWRLESRLWGYTQAGKSCHAIFWDTECVYVQDS